MTDKAIVALESGSEKFGPYKPEGAELPLPYQALVAFAERQTQKGAIADIRHDTTSLLARIVRQLALRVVEAQGASGGVSAATGYARPGRVEIIPR